MTTENQKVTMFNGERRQLLFHVTQTDPVTGETNDKNLTDAFIRWRLLDSSGLTILEKTTDGEDEVTVTSATTGEFTVDLYPEDTEVVVGSFKQEARVRYSADDQEVVTTGSVKIKQSFTYVEVEDEPEVQEET